jgi:anti-sigma regulatory factor (Ser/Thr protein kinase)
MLVLGEGPRSVGTARRQARSALSSWDTDERATDDVLLVLSELVTNAVLHAGDAQSVGLVLYDDRVRVEVADRSRAAPSPSGYGPDAHTGRGLALVRSMTIDWGVAHQAQGKVVWADVPLPDVATGPPVPPPSAGPGADRGRTDGRVMTTFLQVPVGSYLELCQQNDALLRDVDLLLIGAHRGLSGPVPDALLAACRRLREGFGDPAGNFREDVLAAAASGRERVDLSGPLPRAGAHLGAAYIELIEEIEAFAADGHLFVEPPTPEVLELRRWFVHQAMAQEAGAAPTQAE